MDTVVAVVGQGYVGLPLAVAAAGAGHRVFGVERDAARVKSLNTGESHVGDVPSSALAEYVADGRYQAVETVAEATGADIVVLCVPTPYHNDAPDLSYVESAAAEVGASLRPGMLVILESTTYPGTTEEVLAPILEQASGLRAGVDFDLVFSPERIDPGNSEFNLHNTPKIVGGTTPQGTRRAADFYRGFVERVVEVSRPKTAEMAKLLENTFRHINIALVNELAMLSRDLEVDIWEVIDAAASKPFGFMPFYPGPGVGGHCIPVDPMYLSWRVRQFGGAAKFIDLARDVNAAMPLYCGARIQELLNERAHSLNGSRILILGVAYKPNVSDLRESPALILMEWLLRRGAVVEYHDAHVPMVSIEGYPELTSVPLSDDIVAGADCVVVHTHHDGVDYEAVARQARMVFDTRRTPGLSGANVRRL